VFQEKQVKVPGTGNTTSENQIKSGNVSFEVKDLRIRLFVCLFDRLF
jgi:hypothetical protein